MIPDDVMQDAHEAYVYARRLARGAPCEAGEMIWSPIAKAILAERARCASIAQETAEHIAEGVGQFNLAARIAEAIRASPRATPPLCNVRSKP